MEKDRLPIRVLNLFTIMDRGGAETMVMNYYRHVDRTKVQFDFMVHRQGRGAYDDEIEALGGRIYRMPAIRPWTEYQYRKTVRKFYQEHPEYQIIHAHMSELGYYDFMEAKKAEIPVRICHAHNRPYGIDLKSPVRWYYKKRMMPYITHMFMCGEESGEWLFGKKNRDRFIQMNNAIDAAKYRYDETIRQRKRLELGLEDKLVIGHVGRFCPQKNHSFLIEVFREICKKRKDGALLLIGDGEERSKIEKKVSECGVADRVLFLGVRSDVAQLLQAMDVFLFPSLFEGLSVASIEAQAAGLPVLISERIPIECKKTDLVQVMDLEKNSRAEWAEKAIQMSETERRDTFSEIKNCGFDIQSNAEQLQQFYLKAFQGEIDGCLF